MKSGVTSRCFLAPLPAATFGFIAGFIFPISAEGGARWRPLTNPRQISSTTSEIWQSEMEATDQSQETSIESLPNDLLVLILASSGCKSIIKASAVSKRMQIIFKTFHNISIFSAGSSTSPLLEEAVKESASRAMAGMLGHVSFALIFTCNHERKKGPSPAALLSNHLPRGTPIVGAASTGLMGIDEEGNPFEISPGDNIQHGVSVLLGHLPGAICRVFCDCSKPTNPIQTSLEQWTGLDQKDRGWIPVSCWLLAQGGRRAARVTSALIEWLQRRELRVQGFSYPTIAGGESSGGLDFHPGDQEGQERVTGWFSPQGARYCGLMILKESLTSTAAEMMMTPSPLPPPRSTVLAIHGSGPISTASVWTGFKNLAVERVQNGDVQVAVVTTPHISSIRRLNDNNCEVGSGFLHQVQEETEQFISHGYPKICLWSSDGDSPDLDPRSMIAAVRSGFGAIGDLYDQEDILAIFDGHDENIVQRILERGHERVRCCLVWIHEGGPRSLGY